MIKSSNSAHAEINNRIVGPVRDELRDRSLEVAAANARSFQ
jgi:hypothetical protein